MLRPAKWFAFALLLSLPFFGIGCIGEMQHLQPPPFGYALMHHSRLLGVNASIPTQTGTELLTMKLGWGSDVWILIPVSTNELFAPPISDGFKLGQSLGLSPDTQIVENFQSGFARTNTPAVPTFLNYSPNGKLITP